MIKWERVSKRQQGTERRGGGRKRGNGKVRGSGVMEEKERQRFRTLNLSLQRLLRFTEGPAQPPPLPLAVPGTAIIPPLLGHHSSTEHPSCSLKPLVHITVCPAWGRGLPKAKGSPPTRDPGTPGHTWMPVCPPAGNGSSRPPPSEDRASTGSLPSSGPWSG